MFAAIVIGTDDDPQNIRAQEDKLKSADVKILHSTTEVVDYVNLRLGRGGTYTFPLVNLEQLEQPLLQRSTLDWSHFTKA